MAHIAIYVGSLALVNATTLKADGIAVVSVADSDPITFQVEYAFSALAVTINNAIRDAAITAAEAAGHTIGALDKKTLYAGAIGV